MCLPGYAGPNCDQCSNYLISRNLLLQSLAQMIAVAATALVDAITSTGQAQLAPNVTVEPFAHSVEPARKECLYFLDSTDLIRQMSV